LTPSRRTFDAGKEMTMRMSKETNSLLSMAVLAVGATVIVVLSAMTVARPAQWTMMAVPVPTLTSEQRYDKLMGELYTAVDEHDPEKIWRILDEIDELLGRKWPPTPAQIDAVCSLCAELDCGKDIGVCFVSKHIGK